MGTWLTWRSRWPSGWPGKTFWTERVGLSSGPSSTKAFFIAPSAGLPRRQLAGFHQPAQGGYSGL